MGSEMCIRDRFKLDATHKLFATFKLDPASKLFVAFKLTKPSTPSRQSFATPRSSSTPAVRALRRPKLQATSSRRVQAGLQQLRKLFTVSSSSASSSSSSDEMFSPNREEATGNAASGSDASRHTGAVPAGALRPATGLSRKEEAYQDATPTEACLATRSK